MGSFRTLTILLTLGVWGAATEGAPPEGAATPSPSPSRAQLPAPAAAYLKGGIGLFNTGDPSGAAKYLKVAGDYRDQLQPAEQAQLDEYLAKLKPAPSDPSVQPASTASAPEASPSGPAPTADAPAGTARGTTDLKQDARWKLQAAREKMRMGDYDGASQIVAQVQQMPVKWGLFDETPAKMAEAIAKARPKMTAATATAGARDKRTALAKLKEARDLLATNQFEQAEAIAIDVNSWGLAYSVWEDKPAKVAAAARVLRKRDVTRSMPLKAQPSQGVYDVLVSEARHLAAIGQFDQAEAKARQAMKMNVVPSLTADRPEAVLNDIATARGRTPAVSSAKPVANEPPSMVAEREANDMLAKGLSDAAAAKFIEADALKTREMAQPPASVAVGSPVDPSVRRTAAPAIEAPAPMPGGGELATPPALEPPPVAPGPLPAPSEINAPPAGLPAPDAPPSLTADAPPAGNKGEELLAQAKSLFSSGNYPAARDKANEAKAGNYGVAPQADEVLAQIALSEQGGALAVYEAALDALRKNDVPRARSLLNEVASSGAALDEAMMQKVQDLLLKLPKDGAGKAVAADVPANDAEQLKAQQINAEVGTKVAEARRMMETDPEKAIALLQTTLASVKAADLPQTVARTMTRRLEVAIELARKDKVGFDSKMLDKNAKAEIEGKKLRILEADKAKLAATKDIMDKAEKAQSEGNYAKAEELARRAVEIDPNNVAATIMAYKSNLQRHYETSVRDKKDKEEGFINELHDVDKTMVINNEASRNGISYPKNFKELSDRRRQAFLSDVRPRSSSEVTIDKELNKPITLNFNDTSLSEAIAFIQNYTGLNVMLDPKALNDEGLSRDSKVTLQANSIKLKSALKFMLRPLGLTFKIEDDVLLITSPQASRDKMYSWTYPVADLVIAPSKAQPSSMTPAAPMAMPGTDPASLQAMAMNTTQANAGTPTALAGQRVITESDMMPLVQLITNTIAPGSWRVIDPSIKGDGAYGMGGAFGGGGAGGAGGGADAAADPAQPGSITPFMLSISLIIRHTAEVHEEVAELLKQLRRLQDLQVSVEVRFITVSDDFFEQIGVDFDFNIQSKAVGKKTTFAAPNPAAALFPFNSNINGGGGGNTTGGGGTGGNTTGGTTTTGGGNTGGNTGGTGGGGGQTSGGGFAGGGGTTGGGGGGGISGGGFGGGGGGVGGAGGFGGGNGGTGGGTGTGTAGGTSGSTTTPTYLVNPFLDHSLGRRTPVVVGTSAGGIRNFTSNLGIPFTQGGATTALNVFNGVPTAGATLGISFLSDLEMYLFLTAAQGDARNNIVQAPKITTFNGAQAFIQNAEQQYYIAALTPIVGPGSVAFFPTPAPLNDGVVLGVTPVVSADRRYVRLSLAPVFQTINGLQSFPVPAAVGGGGLGGQGTSITGQIQLPLVTNTTINTTVTVPDGGTVLLGGVKRMREQRLEYGVPVLAKTPYINRLFRNIGIGRRTDSLMLMVTPKIIILEEEEDRLGVKTVAPNP